MLSFSSNLARQTVLWCMVGLAVLLPPTARAQNYPLLEELNRQTQSLYQDVQGGIVRVQLPVPKWVREAANQADPLGKWGKVVDPTVRTTLERHKEKQLRGAAGKLDAVISPAGTATRPAVAEAEIQAPGWKATRTKSGETVLEPAGEDGSAIVLHADAGREAREERSRAAGAFGGLLRPRQVNAAEFTPNNIGLLLDEEGHLLVPLYIEPETMADGPVKVAIGDRALAASFVGSDELTNITILKLTLRGVGRPVRMGMNRPNDGSLVMMLNPNSADGRLAMWTGGEKDYGVIVSMDGSVAGIARYGQFLGGNACQLVVQQLISQGKVQRAILGTRLTEVRQDNPMRQQRLELADRPALLVEEVQKESRAEKAGLQVGDLIIQLGDAPVGDLTTWAALSAQGGTSTLQVIRDNERVELQIDLKAE